MNPYVPSVFELEDEFDAYILPIAYEYHQRLVEEENRPRATRTPIFRDREGAETRLMKDYFDPHCRYPLKDFRKRYRMRRKLFLRIVKDIENYEADPLPAHFDFFRVRPDATGRMSMSVIVKCTMAVRQLAYGNTADTFDEYLQMADRTGRKCLWNFNLCIIDLYIAQYLRKPTSEDIDRIYDLHLTKHGFPGMLGSIDCMHWEWKNCPVGWQGQYAGGYKRYPTIMLEAVASQDLWIWHAFFGMAGANNDINVLDNSPLFDDLLNDKAPIKPYAVNGVVYENGYYLADGIYPQWASFVKSFTHTTDAKHSYFKRRQEAARKDVERAFGVLQGRWGILRQPARAYEVNTIRRVMYSCIILHNMILEDQKGRVLDWNDNYFAPTANMQRTWVERCDTYRRKNKELKDQETHQSLQRNLMEHIWQYANHEDEDEAEAEDEDE